jgi:hypothetical protein
LGALTSNLLLHQQLAGREQHVFRLDGEQARFGFRMASVVAAAQGAAQYFEPGPERTIPARVSGSIDAHDRPAKSTGKVERTGVAGDTQGYAAREGYELIE